MARVHFVLQVRLRDHGLQRAQYVDVYLRSEFGTCVPTKNATRCFALICFELLLFQNSPCITTGQQELAILGMQNTNIAYNFMILGIMFVVYRLIAYLALLYVDFMRRHLSAHTAATS